MLSQGPWPLHLQMPPVPLNRGQQPGQARQARPHARWVTGRLWPLLDLDGRQQDRTWANTGLAGA